MNFWCLYKISIKKMLKSPAIYSALAISFFVSLFVFLLLPISFMGADILRFYESSEWSKLSMQGTFVVFAFSSALVGETNANANEKIYFLSKPVSRNTFLWAKCISTLTVNIVMVIISLLVFVAIIIWEAITDKEQIFNRHMGNNAECIFCSYIAIVGVASFISTIYRYQIRAGTSSIVFTGILLLYAILCPLFVDLDGSNSYDNTMRMWWNTIPAIGVPVLGIPLIGVGWRIFLKSEIES